jgi:3-hydroxyacyl-[acyl-carrier-protein] dehydratase
VKNVTAAEEYLADHFPGFPVLPGVMMLETLVQAARRLADSLANAPEQPLVIADVRNVKYGNMVRPGQTLRVSVALKGRDGQGLDFQGVGTVDEQVAVQGRFRLVPLDTIGR